jgi:tetratricopeptide (TPR) repeat protein
LLLIAFTTSENSYSQAILSLGPEKSDSRIVRYYIRKFNSQAYLKQNDSAIVTGKQIIRMRPNNAYYTYQIGMLYEKNGDSVAATGYYKHALSIFNSELDTMDTHSWRYNIAKIEKAVVLLLLGQKDAGDSVINELLSVETIDSNKQYLLLIMRLSRKELIYGSPKTKGMAYVGHSSLIYHGAPASKNK